MKRTQIQLTKNQWRKIRQIAFNYEISISEAMRRLIDKDWLKKERDKIFGSVNVESLEIKTRVENVPLKNKSVSKVRIPKRRKGQDRGEFVSKSLKDVARDTTRNRK